MGTEQQRSVDYIRDGKWVLPAVPVKRRRLGMPLQLGVVFRNPEGQLGSMGERWPFILVVCDPDKLECVFTFVDMDTGSVSSLGRRLMEERGEPYSAEQIVEIGFVVD